MRGSFAQATASARPVTWSLAKTFETWLRTVFSDMTRGRGRRGPAGRRPRTTVRTSSTVDLRRPHGGRLERWSFRAVMTAMTLVSVGGAGVLLDVGPQRTRASNPPRLCGESTAARMAYGVSAASQADAFAALPVRRS